MSSRQWGRGANDAPEASMNKRSRLDRHYEALPIAYVESSLVEPADAPNQGDEGAPAAWLVFVPEVIAGLSSLKVGGRIVLLTWLHRARRDVLRTYPGDDVHAPYLGVFSLRSPDRPNPIGLHPLEILAISSPKTHASNLHAPAAT